MVDNSFKPWYTVNILINEMYCCKTGFIPRQVKTVNKHIKINGREHITKPCQKNDTE